MTPDPDLPQPQATPGWRTVLLHWLIFTALMTALIGGAALIF